MLLCTLQSNLCTSGYSELCGNIMSRRNTVLDEWCLCDLPLIVPFSSAAQSLGELFPLLLLILAQAGELLGPKYMKIIFSIVSCGNSCIYYSMYLTYRNQWLYFTNWAILCKGGDRIAMRREDKAVGSKSFPPFPRQNILQFGCVLCKESVFRYVVPQMLMYEQGKVQERIAIPEVAAVLIVLLERTWVI